MTDARLLSPTGGTRGSRGRVWAQREGARAAGSARGGSRARLTRKWPQSQTVPGTGPSLFQKVEPFPSKPMGFDKERGGRSERRARLGGLCIYQKSPGLGKCLRWGHVAVPGESGGIDRLQPGAPRIPRGGGAAAAAGALGRAPRLSPLVTRCHLLLPAPPTARHTMSRACRTCERRLWQPARPWAMLTVTPTARRHHRGGVPVLLPPPAPCRAFNLF